MRAYNAMVDLAEQPFLFGTAWTYNLTTRN
jgi:hypothetical protein